MSDPIRLFAEHVSRTRFETLPDAAVQAARVFLLDTIGVGLVGTNGPRVADLIDSSAAMMGEGVARCWGHRRTLSAPGAAMRSSIPTSEPGDATIRGMPGPPATPDGSRKR